MKKKLINSLIGSVVVVAYILFADYLFELGFTPRDNIIYQINLFLLTPSIFVMAVITGWNRGVLGDVPNYAFIVLSFLIYFIFFYLVQIIISKIKAKTIGGR